MKSESESETLDYYAFLGIPDNASSDDIKRVYRQRLEQHHPENNPDSIDAAIKTTQLINQVYLTLSNPQTRAKYDGELKTSRFRKQKTTALITAVLGADVSALRLALSFNLPFVYAIAKTEVIIDNRKLILNAVEITIIRKRYDMFQLLFPYYATRVDAYIETDACRIYELASEYYQQDIFSYLRKGAGRQSALTQLCRSSLREEAVIALLAYYAENLMTASVLDALFNDNITEEKARGINNLIGRIGLTTFVSGVFKGSHVHRFPVTNDRKMPDDLYLSRLKALNINLANLPTRPGIFSWMVQLPETTNFTAILNSLTAFGLLPQLKDFLQAAISNFDALLSYLDHDASLEKPRLTDDDLKQIFIALVRSKKRSEKFSDILKALYSRGSNILLTVDEELNNCLHLNLLYGNQDSMEQLTTLLMSKLTVEQVASLYYGKNKAQKTPKDYQKKHQLAALLTWINAKSVPTRFFAPAVRRNPHVEFLRELKPYIDCIADDDFRIFNEMVAKLTPAHFHNPAIGFCLLQKAIASGRVPYVDLLLRSGCDIYLQHGNPLHRVLYTWVNKTDVEQSLLRTEEEVNKVVVEKRASEPPADPKVELKRNRTK